LEKLEFDAFVAFNFLCFGPDERRDPNVLIEDTLFPKPNFPSTFLGQSKKCFC
jgi:hypothetical protein